MITSQELRMNTVVDFTHVNLVKNQVRTRYDEESGAMYYYMKPEPRPCFNKVCLTELYKNQSTLEKNQGLVSYGSESKQVDYLVLASDIPGVFNLGGDLNTFKDLIVNKQRQTLKEYAQLCIDNVWTFYNMQAPVTSIALVQGQAMGGGFESALSAHVLVAEKSAVMGFPEVLFNLFPGMGALSFLSRKIGMPQAEKMVRSGKVYTGEELFKMGVVDVLAEDGMGEHTLNAWIKKNHRSINSFRAINRAKQRVNPLTYDELNDIVDVWVDAALRLDDRNLKVMQRLVRAQNSKTSTDAIEVDQEQFA